MSAFRLSIVRVDGGRVTLRPGIPEERDFVEAIVDETAKGGIGLFRTEAQVRKALRAAIDRVMMDAKRAVVPG